VIWINDMKLDQLGELIRLKQSFQEKEISFSNYIEKNICPQEQFLSIHLGIDFGTSFTKICYRQLENEETGVIHLENGDELGFIESSVKLNGMEIITPYDEDWDTLSNQNQIVKINNLKMALFDNKFLDIKISSEKLETIAIYFLARTIQQARKSFIEQQKERCFNKLIRWSTSIGVPVKYFDSEEIPVFQNIFNIAWKLSEIVQLPKTILKVSGIIKKVNTKLVFQDIPCYTVPEVVAAISSFIKSQASIDNIYLFMDIGGGTFDISSFSLINHQGEIKINILDTQIEPLGIKGFVNKYAFALNGNWKENGKHIKNNIERCLFDPNRNTHNIPGCNWEKGEDDIKLLVAKAIMNAKEVDDQHWFSKMHELQIFIGGGGSESPWFKESINRTHVNRLKSAGVPKFHFQKMEIPDNFHLNEEYIQKFHRYAVAYGLSCPCYEYPQIIGFPRVNPKIEKNKVTKPFDYDSKSINIYGKIL